MARKSLAMLVLSGMLAGFAPFAPLPHAAAHGGGQGIVQGEVTQKFVPYKEIAVDGWPYQVPLDIYNRVDVGAIVRFDGKNWTIVSGGI